MDEQRLAPFDLTAPRTALYPCYVPFRRPLPGQPETHEQRMARTDIQLDQERLDRASLAALDAALEDWEATNGAYDNNPAAQEVLKLHAPVLIWRTVVCNECSPDGREETYETEWPCGTFRVIKELL